MIFLASIHELFLLRINKGIIITNAFQKSFGESKRKLGKLWVNKGSEFYNRSSKSWLQEENYKYMTSILKNLYIDKLGDTFNEYKNTYPFPTDNLEVRRP